MESLLLGASAVAILVGLGGLVYSHRRWPRAPAHKPVKRSRVVTACLLGLLGLAAATSFAQIGVSRRGCDSRSLPGPEEALIYRDSNYRGDCRILSVGNYANSTYFGLPNDSVSSFKVGENVRIDLFLNSWFDKHDVDWIFPFEGPDPDDPDYNPYDPIHWRGVPYLSTWLAPSRDGNWNDETSSIRVQRKDHLKADPGPGQVVLFTEVNFNQVYEPNPQGYDRILKDVGEYPTTAEVGLENDSISSIRVGPNTRVEVCRDAWFSNMCQTFTSDQPYMSETRVGNNRVTSVRVSVP